MGGAGPRTAPATARHFTVYTNRECCIGPARLPRTLAPREPHRRGEKTGRPSHDDGGLDSWEGPARSRAEGTGDVGASPSRTGADAREEPIGKHLDLPGGSLSEEQGAGLSAPPRTDRPELPAAPRRSARHEAGGGEVRQPPSGSTRGLDNPSGGP